MDPKNPEDWSSAITIIVTIASVAANFISPHSMVGRVVHLLAFNLRNGAKNKPPPPPSPRPPKIVE